MFRIVRTRTIRCLENRAVKERIMRDASDNTASQLLNLRDEVKREMLVAGMPEDATLRDLIRWHREQAAFAAGFSVDVHEGLQTIAQEAQAIVEGNVLVSSCAIRIRDKVFVLLGARTPDEQMTVLRMYN